MRKRNSIKGTRINELVKNSLSNIIRSELSDPRIGSVTTVTAVEVAPDLATCRAYISTYGDEKKLDKTIAALKNAEKYIRKLLAEDLNLRNTPEIRFIPDHSMEYGMKMDALIASVTLDLKKDETDE